MDLPSTLRIRDLDERDDLVAMTDLLHRSYAALAAQGWNYTAVSQSVEVTRRRATQGGCLVAEMDGRIVGTLAFHGPDPSSECPRFRAEGVVVLEQFAVEPGLQGGGIGRALVEAAEARARALGAREILGDTAEPAVHLVRWYERLGWSVVDTVRWPGKTYRSVVFSKRVGDGAAPASAAPRR